MSHSILIPDIGDFKDVEVIDVLVKPGDVVALETPLVTLETEKATMDVPSTSAGVVKSVAIKKGDRVGKGAVIVEVDEASASSSAASGSVPSPKQEAPAPSKKEVQPVEQVPQPANDVAPAPKPVPVIAPAVPSASFSSAHASPSVRRFARELGADLARVKGTGEKNRITHDDVKAWVKQALASPAASGGALPKVAEVDFAKFGGVEIRPLSRIQKISGPRLHASWVNVPHVWQMDEADITELEDARTKLKSKAAKEGIKLTPLAFVMRACVKALQEFPLLNTSLDAEGKNLVHKKYIHLGFAADTPNGLVVPVVRDANR
ncbi:MAG: 2-oxo acid dehydrogenase subunit E2, partial [Candidatus Obscuribacterales bacterium]|nr:2-oxo acid dehydrogenase subunit E2 [Steroidobacteraceae bacterium]